MWREQAARRYFEDAGFALQRVEHIEGDPINVYYVLARD